MCTTICIVKMQSQITTASESALFLYATAGVLGNTYVPCTVHVHVPFYEGICQNLCDKLNVSIPLGIHQWRSNNIFYDMVL